MRASPSLRPRSVFGIYDAAIEISVSSPRVAALSFLGAAPLAILSVALVYAASERVPLPGGSALAVMACALATMWRFIPAGATSRVVLSSLRGEEVGASAALWEALHRAPALLAAGSLSLWVLAISLPMALLPLVFAGGVWMGAPLMMERGCAPWSLLSAGRKVMGERVSAAGGLTLIWLLALPVLALGLAMLLAMLLHLARGLSNAELGFLQNVLSLENPIYLPALFAIAFLLLEPVRQSSLALLLADAKVRREGIDLRQEAESLLARKRPRGPTAALLILLVSIGAPALPASADRGDAMATGGPSTAEVERRLEALGAESLRLHGEKPQSLSRLARRVRRDLDEGRAEAASRRLSRAETELERTAAPRERGAPDAAGIAREVLDRPEFKRLDRRDRRVVDLPESLWERFLAWLERRFERSPRASSGERAGGRAAPLLDLLWKMVLVLFAGLVVWLVLGTLGGKSRTPAEETALDSAEPEGKSGPGALGLDPLSKPAKSWLEEADRLAAAGAFREALRAIYLALLAQLHRARAIDYSPSRSNWEHVLLFRGPEEQRALMSDLTARFDRAWYGGREVLPEELRRARAGALSLLEETVPAASGASSG